MSPKNMTIPDVAMEFVQDISNYLPIGTLFLPKDKNNLLPLHSNEWRELQASELTSLDIAQPARKLAEKHWIRAFLYAHNDHRIPLLRIYVLPDDVGRRYVDKSDRTLQKDRLNLIAILDSTLAAWNGFGKSAFGKDSVGGAKLGESSGSEENQARHASMETSKRDDGQDSLFYLFNTLPSPSPRPEDMSCSVTREAMTAVLESGSLPGLKTPLYPYQQRTVATMIQREVQPAKTLDPRLQLLRTPTQETYYYDSQTGSLFRHRKEYDEARGGCLSESMGLGKTLVCLSTILATKGHWPSVPPQYSLGRHPVRPQVASLMQMAAATVGRQQIPWRSIFQKLAQGGEEHRNCLKVLEQNVGSYIISPAPTRYSKRATMEQKGKTLRLSNATLIIVPQNLLSQWRNEIETHFEEGSFETLFVDNDDVSVPPSDTLLKYDIIIMARSRFEREISPPSIALRGLKVGCWCSFDEDCHCSISKEYQSPLKDLHFLRILQDEGHEFSSGKKSQTYWALSEIHVDRKWIVSGTPTSGLMGVEVGTAAQETSETARPTSSILATRRQEAAFVQEMKDLGALRVMVVGFFQLRPWANSKGDDLASWTQYIMPYKNGRRKPASLQALLQSLVVRHRIEDIEADIQLPPLENRVVYLKPSWHDKFSLKIIIINIITNAVTSERADADYMFHAKNRQPLNRLISNLRQSGFYWTSFSQEDVVKTLKLSRQYLDEQTDSTAGCSDYDRRLLEKAISIGEVILASRSWKALSDLDEMGVFVDGLPEGCRTAWSVVPKSQSTPLLIGATQLIKAQKWVGDHLYESADRLLHGLEGLGSKIMTKLWRETPGVGVDELVGGGAGAQLENNQYPKPRKTRPTHSTVPRLTKKLTASQARPNKSFILSEPIEEPGVRTDERSIGLMPALKSALKSTCNEPINPLPADSPLTRSTLCGTVSAKLTYLIDRVLALHSQEKILIFYEGDQIAYYMAQAFEILGIRFLIYTQTLDLTLKNAYIATFNATPTFRVMLMNIHEAAHGLHIASASRVFFVNPVWQPTVEAQAIKRAHRIGQTRPVYVETLVLKDTLEYQMLQRRKGMTAQEHQKAEKSLLDDDTMNTIIKNAQLIPFCENEIHDSRAQVAWLRKPQRLFGRPGTGAVDVEDPYADLIFLTDTPKAIRKTRERFDRNQDARVTGDHSLKRKGDPEDVSNHERSPSPFRRRTVGFATDDGGSSLSPAPLRSMTVPHPAGGNSLKRKRGSDDASDSEASPPIISRRKTVGFAP